MHRSTRTGLALLALVVLMGCAHTRDAGFVKAPERMTHHRDFPFKKEWYSEEADWSRFETVYIAPVDTKHLLQMNWWQKASLEGEVSQRDAQALAGYARAQLERAFREDQERRFRVVDRPSRDTLVIELAIVELTPTKAWLNAVEMAALFMSLDKGHIAIESRWRHGPEGPVVSTLADGMSGRVTLLSAADYTWWGHAKNALDAWSRQFVAVADGGWSERVRGRFPVALITW